MSKLGWLVLAGMIFLVYKGLVYLNSLPRIDVFAGFFIVVSVLVLAGFTLYLRRRGVVNG